MFIFLLAFLLGDLFLQSFSHLPSLYRVLGIILLFLIGSHFLRKKWQYGYIPLACALGFAWSLWYAHLQMAWTLPDDQEGKTICITGWIASIPEISPHRVTFLFAHSHHLIRLSWQEDDKKLWAGDQWKLLVRLKKIHGMANPGGFDYEAWALQEGIRAQGYVVNSPENIRLSSYWYHYPLNRIRQYFLEKMLQQLPVSHTSPWIIALALGERQGISTDNWQVLRNTGTNHLMAIAGLHIGFMAAFAFAIVSWGWRRIPRLTLKMPAQHAGAIASLIMAFIYSALAGFSIPTQRACIMLFLFLIVLLLRRNMTAWHAWSIALLCVLLINPLSVLAASIWLSFGSVALIIYGVGGRLATSGGWWKWGRIQWVIALGLIPLSIGLFQQCSFVSFVANSIAIPWVGFVVVPLTLLGCFLLLFPSSLGGWILWIADKILSVLWNILIYLSHLSWATWYHTVPHEWILVAAGIGVILLLLPAGFPGRWLGVVWVLPLILYKSPAPKLGEIGVTLLDVGQGLSVVVQTQHHILVFDAGPKLSDSYDMGESVVLPYLHSLDAKKIDMLVISHPDNDHIGGSGALLKQIPIVSIKSSTPSKLPSPLADFCLRGTHWQWDHVNFAFLYPAPDKLNLDNDSSCVLRITNGVHSILLAGDIEKVAEQYLSENEAGNLLTDILVAPHHGSKTSASNDFIQEVHPQIVLFPVGYRNRYHFPHESVVKKYQTAGAILYDTIRAGAIQFQLTMDKKISEPRLYRLQHLHYWNESLPKDNTFSHLDTVRH